MSMKKAVQHKAGRFFMQRNYSAKILSFALSTSEASVSSLKLCGFASSLNWRITCIRSSQL